MPHHDRHDHEDPPATASQAERIITLLGQIHDQLAEINERLADQGRGEPPARRDEAEVYLPDYLRD